MTDALVFAKIPYSVDYHVPRGRRLRGNRVWEDIPLILRAPTDAEAPVAYRIAQTGPKDDALAAFEIRSFDRQLWWPVLDNRNRRRASKDFLDGLAAGDCYPLEVIQLGNVPLQSSSKPTFDEWLARTSVREVVQTSRDTQVAWAQRGASETMICEDVVYVAAGEPMYFGLSSEHAGDCVFSLSVGATPWAAFLGFTNRIPGLHRDERRSALFDANVFDVLTMDKDIARLEGDGFSVRFDSKVEIVGNSTGAGNALHMCANAALLRLLMEKPIAAAFRERIPDGVRPRVATDLIALDVCQEVLRDIVELYPPSDLGCIFRDDILCAQSVLRRFTPSLAQEDEEALASLSR